MDARCSMQSMNLILLSGAGVLQSTVRLCALRDNQNEDLFTLERPGCCKAKPFLCCFPIFQNCADEMTIHKGRVDGEAGKVTNPRPIYRVKQTAGCSGDLSHPQVKVFLPHTSEEEMSFNGPQCFGCCTELCKESRFNAVGKDGRERVMW